MIKIDYRFSMREALGKSGLGKAQLAAALKRARKVREGLAKDKAAGGLGFANVLHDRQMVSDCLNFAQPYQGKIQNILVLGIGGSALGARTLGSALRPLREFELKEGRPRLFVCDNLDPDWLSDIFSVVFSEPSLVLVVSKSGATPEIAAQLLYLMERLQEVYSDGWRQHLAVVTDPEKGLLRSFARQHNLASLPVPPAVGGRYSVLTPVGLLPAALIGIDIQGLLEGARKMDETCFASGKIPAPAELLAALFYHFAKKGRKNLALMPYCSRLADFSEWFAQLWAESLGKLKGLSGKKVRAGSTPLRALGATDQHSQLQLYLEGPEDKLVCFLKVEKFTDDFKIPDPFPGLKELKWLSGHTLGELLNTELFATSASLAKSGQPSLTVSIPRLDAHELGGLFYLFELATVIAGGLWNVNPFDQPGVELGKQYTAALMGRREFAKKKKELDRFRKKGKAHVWPAGKR